MKAREANKSSHVGTAVSKLEASAPLENATAMSKHEIAVKRIVGEITTALVAAGEKYLSLVLYVRKHKAEIPAGDFRKWLIEDMGMSKSKTSDVQRLSEAPEEVFSKYQVKELGWHEALKITRGNIDEMKRVSPALVDDKDLTALAKEAHAELVESEENPSEVGGPLTPAEKAKKKKAGWCKALDRGAEMVLRSAALIGAKPKIWDIGNGWTLSLIKSPVSEAAAGAKRSIAQASS